MTKHILTLLTMLLAPLTELHAADVNQPGVPASRPNIIVILVDDLGYECIGANGGKSYQTPHLDGLARTGVRFEQCYAQPNCTPTRVQMMTGMSNVRTM